MLDFPPPIVTVANECVVGTFLDPSFKSLQPLWNFWIQKHIPNYLEPTLKFYSQPTHLKNMLKSNRIPFPQFSG